MSYITGNNDYHCQNTCVIKLSVENVFNKRSRYIVINFEFT